MKFQELRKAAGYKTQYDLAKILNSKQSTVAMWESSKRVPRPKMLVKLSKLFDCSVEELIRAFGEGHETTESKKTS